MYAYLHDVCMCMSVCVHTHTHVKQLDAKLALISLVKSNSSLDLIDKPVAVPSNVLTSRTRDVSIGNAPRGDETATVSWATPSLSMIVTVVLTKPTAISAKKD